MTEPIEVIIMRGISGSGKSTHAQELLDSKHSRYNIMGYILSSDNIRKELTGDISCQSKNREVFELMESRLKSLITESPFNFIVVDATHLTSQSFAYVQRALTECVVPSSCVSIVQCDISLENAIANVKHRASEGGLDVPEYVIKKQYDNLLKHDYDFTSFGYQIYHHSGD